MPPSKQSEESPFTKESKRYLGGGGHRFNKFPQQRLHGSVAQAKHPPKPKRTLPKKQEFQTLNTTPDLTPLNETLPQTSPPEPSKSHTQEQLKAELREDRKAVRLVHNKKKPPELDAPQT